MSTLDKSHPFRASVDLSSTATADASSLAHTAQAPLSRDAKSAPVNQEEKESLITSLGKAFAKLSPKKRLLVIALFGGSICYAYLSLYDALFGPAHPQRAAAHSSMSMGTDPFADDEITRSEPSWFQRTFCTGVKRKGLCD